MHKMTTPMVTHTFPVSPRDFVGHHCIAIVTILCNDLVVLFRILLDWRWTEWRITCNNILTLSTQFMKWTFPSLNLDMSIIQNRDISQKSKQNGKLCSSWCDGSLWAISSGTTLFAQISGLVCRAAGVTVLVCGNKLQFTSDKKGLNLLFL